jgi:CBS domain-containing protein
MKAGEIMTTQVVAVGPETSARSIARLLFANGISAVPVVDRDGVPLGIVSEGDLLPRDESEREARRDWWLKLLAEGEELNPDFLRHLERGDRTAREVMTTPIMTVEENADLVEVAELLATRRIKRVPVVRDGRMIGIVSRADLVKAFAQPGPLPEPGLAPDSAADLAGPSERLAALTRHRSASKPPSGAGDDVYAEDFRGLVAHFEEGEAARRAEARRQTVERHHEEARQLLAAQLSDEAWQRMLREARAAAQKGEEEHLLLRFPCELCTDHGRAVNAPDPTWPVTLRGLAAEVFLRWKNELRSHGFGLRARVVDFPDGIPGDIGLFLAWGR